MRDRKAVERIVERLYKDRLARAGKLPDAKQVREMEKKAARAAMETDNRGRRK